MPEDVQDLSTEETLEVVEPETDAEPKAVDLTRAAELRVCDVKLSPKLTADEYAMLEDYEHAHDLIGLQVELEALQSKGDQAKRETVSPEYSAAERKVDALEAARNKLLEKLEKNFFTWTTKDDERLASLESTIYEAYKHRDSLKHDAGAVVRSMAALQKEMGNLYRRIQRFHFPYVHSLAVARGLTKESLEDWQEKAQERDYEAARNVVKLGKALSHSTGVSKTARKASKVKN